ncbi:hypothetical protein JCM10207_004502 [Rhodosporidiobolus poonsookiae]
MVSISTPRKASYAEVTARYSPPNHKLPLPNPAFLDLAKPTHNHLVTSPEQLDSVHGATRQRSWSHEGSSGSETVAEHGEEDSEATFTGKAEEDVLAPQQSQKDDGWVGRDSGKPGAPFRVSFEGEGGDARATRMRKPPVGLEKGLAEPYLPRANIACTPEAPYGTQAAGWAQRHEKETVLRQHCAFFDRDNDGIIYPLDVFLGFRELGFAWPWCLLAVFIISPALSLATYSSIGVLLLGGISLDKIHRAKHGSDTGVYDSEGRFVPASFEAMFSKYDSDSKGGLGFLDGLRMIHGNRNILDPVGWIGAFFEFGATYLLIWPADGVITREDLRTVYDGSIFFSIAAREKSRARRGGWTAWLAGWVMGSGAAWKENRAAPEPKREGSKARKAGRSREKSW